MLMQEVLLCVVSVVTSAFVYLSATPLDPVQYIRDLELRSWLTYYEPAYYDPSSLRLQHGRVKRSLPRQPLIRLDIRGHGRLFRLKLRPDNSIFADDVVFESTRGPINFDPGVVYTGTLEDDETAIVHGVITRDGLFEGTISTSVDDYHIEPLSRYLPPKTTHESSHSIVYKTSDVQDPRKGLPCASHSLHLNRLEEDDFESDKHSGQRVKRWLLESQSRVPYEEGGSNDYWQQPTNRNRGLLESDSRFPYKESDSTDYWQQPTNRSRGVLESDSRFPYDESNRSRGGFSAPFDLNMPIDEEMDVVSIPNRTNAALSNYIFRNVNKRATVDPRKTTCMLYLQADHMFYQKYGTEEACIEVMTRHVQRVNIIYKSTDFNQDGKADNITFMVKRIKVHTTDALRDPNYRFPNSYGVEKFLELFSGEFKLLKHVSGSRSFVRRPRSQYTTMLPQNLKLLL